MLKTYTYNEKKVVIENGKVIHSDTEHCIVGQKPNLDFLRKCGWKLQKSATTAYAKGLKTSKNFLQ